MAFLTFTLKVSQTLDVHISLNDNGDTNIFHFFMGMGLLCWSSYCHCQHGWLLTREERQSVGPSSREEDD